MKTNDQKTTGNQEREPRCTVTISKGNERTRKVVPESKIGRYRPKNFHLLVDLVHMMIYVRMNGKPKPISANKKGIRGRPLEFLIKLARRAGVFMLPLEIGKMPPCVDAHFVTDNLIQYTRKLRVNLFAEDGAAPRHILTSTSPYKVALSNHLSVCLIEPDTNGKEE